MGGAIWDLKVTQWKETRYSLSEIMILLVCAASHKQASSSSGALEGLA